MIFPNQNKKVNKKRLAKGFLLSLSFLFYFGIALFDVSWVLTNSQDIFYQNAVASVLDGGKNLRAGEAMSDTIIETPVSEEMLEINAEAGVSVLITPDEEKVLFAKNKNKKLPIASLTKLMTALVVLEKYNLDDTVLISESALLQEGVQGVLKKDEVLSVKNLLYITLIESSNRSAFALSEIMGNDVFIKTMNETGQRIGLLNTRFEDVTGLGEGSYSTTRDLVILTRYLFEHYPLFGEIAGLQSFDLYSPNGKLHHTLATTNKLLGKTEGIIAGKTGFTSFSKGCVMVIQKGADEKHYMIHILLGAEDRFLEMEKIINWVNR